MVLLRDVASQREINRRKRMYAKLLDENFSKESAKPLCRFRARHRGLKAIRRVYSRYTAGFHKLKYTGDKLFDAMQEKAREEEYYVTYNETTAETNVGEVFDKLVERRRIRRTPQGSRE